MEKYNNLIASALLSIALIVAALLFRQPAASVAPTPQPADFAAVTSQTITDPVERQVRSALYQQLAAALETDNGERITDTAELGEVLERAQLYRFGTFKPEKYEQLSEVVGGEFAKQLDCETETQPLTPERIAIARQFFLTLSEALR